jgi:hypothetical protein
MVRETCALPADAVARSRKLVKFPIEDIVRRIDQEDHFFEERINSLEVIAASKISFCEAKVAVK